MKKFNVFANWFIKIGLSAVLVVFLILAPFTIMPSLLSAQADVNKRENFEYQGVLELWHIETFEGGSVSRSTFLQKEAINFEKKHKGTYIVVQTMNLEQFELNINAGKSPNILSFGVGVGNQFVNNLVELDGSGIRNDLKISGKQNSKQLAIPYILGGYVLISQNATEKAQNLIGVGLKGTTNPLKAIQQNNMQISNLYSSEEFDSYDAYDKFLKGYYQTLIGTQRDAYRVSNRQQKGLMQQCDFQFLGGYTDLVQYLSVFKSSVIQEKLCKEFVTQITSEDVQKKLKNYNLFSTLQDIDLYDDGIFKSFEDVLSQKLESENAFQINSQINNQKAESYKKVVM